MRDPPVSPLDTVVVLPAVKSLTPCPSRAAVPEHLTKQPEEEDGGVLVSLPQDSDKGLSFERS